MSSNAVLSVRGLSKEYRIFHDSYRPSTAAEAIARKFSGASSAKSFEVFKALDNVSFEVTKGDVVGIIGRNGAGKSTLLKVLSRITEPTSGEIVVRGKIGSLLEVGTGFHPELTGRENIFLNGAILGMRKADIQRQFDAIVDFSEVEQFLDTPVKRYSSGMYVRLAFAVAAHLNPDILIVDEVLAVGDAQFQQKCLGKMQDVSKQDGRTVLFVSHNMGAVRTLCKSCILLSGGEIAYSGSAESGVAQYLNSVQTSNGTDLNDSVRKGSGGIKFLKCWIKGQSVAMETAVNVGKPATVIFRLSGYRPGLSCVFTIYTNDGFPVYNCTSTLTPNDKMSSDSDSFVDVSWETEQWLLLPGMYRINAAVLDGDQLLDHIEGILTFESHAGDVNGQPAGPNPHSLIALPCTWSISAANP